MKREPEYISTNEALDIIRESWLGKTYKPNRQTLYEWTKKYNLGFKFMGRWHIDKNKLKNLIKEGGKLRFASTGVPDGNKKKKKK